MKPQTRRAYGLFFAVVVMGAITASAAGLEWGTEEMGVLVAVTFGCALMGGLLGSLPGAGEY